MSFRHQFLLASALIKPYYEIMNEDPEGAGFPGALTELDAQVQVAAPIDDALRAALEAAEDDPMMGLRAEMLAFPPGPVLPVIREFSARWHLPRKRGVQDLWDSLVWWHSARLSGDRDEPLKLLIVSTGWTSRVVRVPISPLPPEPFVYDMSTDSPATVRSLVDAYVSEVKRRMIAQIQQSEARHSHDSAWVEMPKRYRNPEEISILVRRLYLWNVAKWSWTKIAAEECRSLDAVRQSVKEFAPKLDIPVREGTPGRPTDTKNPGV